MGMVWLSHVFNEDTPLYGGGKGIVINSKKSLLRGNTCNESKLQLTSHAGTHVDAPYHFFSNGKTIDAYLPEELVFNLPTVLNIKAHEAQLISCADFTGWYPDANTDILLIKTGFEKNRDKEIYWRQNPGLAADLAAFFRSLCPSLRAVGMDFISISSFQRREEGRIAHKAFLENGILLIEDMSLNNLKYPFCLKKVIVCPLRFRKADGAPCTVIGWISDV